MTDKIILGTAQFGLDYGINNDYGRPGKEEINSILDYAFKQNVRLLDTAEAYGNSHELIGEYHSQSKNRFEVITKFSPVRNDLIGSLRAQVFSNIRTLNVENLYCYMFHSFRDFESYYQLFSEDIKELKKDGVIKKFGVSVYSNNEIELLLNYDEIELVQFPFNLLDNLSQRDSLITKLKAKGVEIHTRSVFLQGLMFKDLTSLPVKLVPLKPYLLQIKEIAKLNGLNLYDLALNYTIYQNNIDHVLIGVDTLTQLKENITSLKKSVTHTAIESINSILVKETELLNPSNWNS